MPLKAAPVSLRQALDIDLLCISAPYDALSSLGSFMPNHKKSFESSVVKTFKKCVPCSDYQPHISHLADFYSDLICERVAGKKINWLVRVLSSKELAPDINNPSSLLLNRLSYKLSAQDISNIFFKTSIRPPLRSVARLSGGDSLKSRMKYVLQDTFIKPLEIKGTALLIDDIYNTGASMRLYAAALKQFMCVDEVICINLAATRFNNLNDGLGHLNLNISGLAGKSGLEKIWGDSSGVIHKDENCIVSSDIISCGLKFMLEREAERCSICMSEKHEKSSLWKTISKWI